jgi:protein gp37
MANRMAASTNPKIADLVRGTVLMGGWTGKVNCHHDRINPRQLVGRQRREIVAVCWMGDLFHPEVPTSFQARQLLATDAANNDRAARDLPPHIFLYLTKRWNTMVRAVRTAHAHGAKFRGHWWGGTCCTPSELDVAREAFGRIVGNCWLSLEPLLRDPGLEEEDAFRFRWVVMGGMAGGPELDLDVARRVRDWAAKGNVPLIYKQRGGPGPQKVPELDGAGHWETPWEEG